MIRKKMTETLVLDGKNDTGLKIDFMKNRKIYYSISLAILVIGVIFNLVLGLNLDISFKGGTIFQYSYTGEINEEELRAFVDEKIGFKVETNLENNTIAKTQEINISMNEKYSHEKQQEFNAAISEKYAGNNIEKVQINSIDPSMGKSFLIKCLVAIALAVLCLVVYVAFRFRKIGGWSAGVMGLVALAHDIMVAYFTFVVFRIPLDDNFVAVVLSILGYSLNDTIVIYDRIRENRRKMGASVPIGEVVNKSINQSFTRSFNTGLCTFLAIAVIAVLAIIFRLDSVISFAVPMMVGIISGCYSTVCICGPLWVSWQEHKEKKDGGSTRKSLPQKAKA